MKGILVGMAVFLSFGIYAQDIPDGMRINWYHAGTADTATQQREWISLEKNQEDITRPIEEAIENFAGKPGGILIPSGKFRISSVIKLKSNIIIRGAGSDSTQISFTSVNGDQPCFSITAMQTENFATFPFTLYKGTKSLPLIDRKNFKAGEFLELREDNGNWDVEPINWARKSVGQVMQIKSISDSIYLEEALRINFDSSLHPEIRRIVPIKNAGIEALKITRQEVSSEGTGNMFYFSYASDCWIRGVESQKSKGAHVLADASTHLSISGCYFHESYKYDGEGTHGYGITLIDHSGDCLVEDNVFSTLRHAMMVKQGANGNVFGYNYSTNVTRSEIPTDASGDISLHGHYPFANLFEGNIVQTIYLDLTWGPSGPFNTFLRNLTERYGVIMSTGNTQSNDQLFIGNEINGNSLFTGNFVLKGENQFVFGNRIKGASGQNLTIKSLYKKEQPNFWNVNQSWPSLPSQAEPGSGSNPARERYFHGQTKTAYFPVPAASFSTEMTCGSLKVKFDEATVLSSGTIKKYEWSFGDGDTSGNADPIHEYKKAGVYKIILRTYSDKNMEDSATAIIRLTGIPDAEFEYTTRDSLNYSFHIKNPQPEMKYKWSLGDGSIAEGINVVHTYDRPGNYEIKVNATSGECVEERKLTITVKLPPATGIENATDELIEVYPNPALDIVSIKCTPMAGQAVMVTLTDMNGKTVLAKQINMIGGAISLPLPYPRGIYFLILRNAKKAYHVKIIKL
jgi:PKD repeat protein